MKKTTRTARKVLSVFLSVLMILTTLTVAVPGLVLAADTYYVRVYLNVYDGADSDAYGAYTVVDDKSSEFYGKPNDYKWDYGSSWSATDNSNGYDGHINMAGFTLFYGDTYLTEDLSDELIKFQNENGKDKYVDFDPNDTTVTVDYLNNLKSSKEGGIYEPYVYGYTLSEFPTSLFWLNDVESPWTNIGDNDASFAITRITVASNDSSDEHVLWQGYSGAESKAYCYYGEISANGIHTCYDDTQEQMATHYIKYTTSPVGSWYNSLATGVASVYPVNNYLSGGVSASFTEKDPGTVTNIDFINVGDGNVYWINFTNHSTQDATITLFKSDNKGLLDSYYDNYPVDSGATVSFKLNKSSMNGDLNGDPGYYDFSFKYKLDNVYNSDGTTQSDFYQAAGVCTWNTSDDSSEVGYPDGETSNKGMTVNNNNDIDVMNQFAADAGIFETLYTNNNRTDNVSAEYNYWIDTSNYTDWSQTGFRLYVHRWNSYKIHLQSSGTTGTMSIGGNIANNNASLGMADLATSYTSANDALNDVDNWAYVGTPCTPFWKGVNSNTEGTLYSNDQSGVFRFTGNIFQNGITTADSATISFNNMTWVCPAVYSWGTTRYGYFTSKINVYAFDKTDLRNYVYNLGGLGANFAPMRTRFNDAQWNAYEIALKTAKEVLADQKTDQKAVTDAYNALYNATEALKNVTSLKSQVAYVTYTKRAEDYDSDIVSTWNKYLIIPVDTDVTIPAYDSLKWTATAPVVAKQSNITVNYNQYETGIQPVDYRYWRIDFTGVDDALTKADTLINAPVETYSDEYYEKLLSAHQALAAFDRDSGTYTPTHQSDIDNALATLNDLLAHAEDGYDACIYDGDDEGTEADIVNENFNCVEGGTVEHVCIICGKAQVVEIKAPNEGGHTVELWTKVDAINHKGTCTACGAEVTAAHSFTNPDLARPTLVDGNWVDGTYTYTCVCGEEKVEAAVRADYSELEDAVDALEALKDNENLSDAAKEAINNAIADGKGIAQDLVTAEQGDIDALVKELQKVKADADEAIENKELGVEKITEATSGVKVQFIDESGLGTIESVQLGEDEGFIIRVTNGNADSDITITSVSGVAAEEKTLEPGKSADYRVETPTTAGIYEYAITYTIDGLKDAEGNAVTATTKAYLYVKEEAYQPYHFMDEKTGIGGVSKWDHFVEATNYGDFTLISENTATKFSDKLETGTKWYSFGTAHTSYDYDEDGCQAGCTTSEYKTGDGHAATYGYFVDTSLAPTWEAAGFRLRIVETKESTYQNAPLKSIRVANDQAFLDGIKGDDKTFTLTFYPSATGTQNKTWSITSTGTLDVATYANPDEDNELLFGEHKNRDGFTENTALALMTGEIPSGVNEAKFMLSPRIEFNGTIRSESVSMTTHIWLTSYDKAELREAVLNAEQAGYNSEYFNAEKYEAYENALKNAKEVLGKAETNQTEIDEATAALNAAIADLEKAENEAKFVLTVTHSIHESADKNSEATGTEYDYYLLASGEFSPALNAEIIARDTINKHDAQATINVTADSEHTYNYWYIDYSGVQDAIDAADAIINDTENGYSEEYKQQAQDAKDALEDILEGKETTTTTPESQSTVDDAIDAVTALTGHTCNEDVVIKGKDATCDETGLTDGAKCSICGKITVAQETDPATDHNYDIAHAALIVRPELVDGTWTTGTYEATCLNDDSHKLPLEGVQRADYTAFEAAIAQIKEIAAYEGFTDEVKAAILAYAADLESGKYLALNLVADYEYNGVTIKGEQDKIKAFVLELTKDGGVIATLENSKNDPANIKPDYDAWEEAETAYDALDKTNVKAEIITEAEALKAEIAAKEADETLTQATATQVRINEATARLNEIINGIEDGTLVKPDYSGAEGAIEDAKEVADSENIPDDTEAGIEDRIAELEEQLNEIKDSNPSSTDEEVKKDIAEIEQAAKDIIDTYGECAKGNHTDVETDDDHNCDVCGKLDVTSHNYADPQLTRPVYDEEKGEWSDGYYTSTCNCGDTSETTIARADYEAYDKAVADLNALLETGKLTQTAVDMINAALEANDILDDYVATSEEQAIVDDAAAALQLTLGQLTDENGLKKEYEKVDYTNYNAAVNAYEVIKDTMTAEDKAAVEAIKAEIAEIPADGTKAQYQTQVDKAAEDIAAINAKYGDCANGNHTWGNPVLTKEPTADEQGEYTETCGVCGTTQITKVDLADYDEFNTVVDQLEDLLDTENLTDEAKAAIEEALDKAEALNKNLPADVTTKDGKLVEGGQDEIDTLVNELKDVVTDTNAAINDGSALKPDYDAWEEAETAYDALDKTNVKDEIITEANKLKEDIDKLQNTEGLTQATATQDDIDEATDRLNEIIAGITDGTLKDPADYTEVDKDLADAKDKADKNDVVDGVKDDIQEIEDKLNEIKNDPTTNADDQDEIDALEKELEDIIAGITDGSLVKVDYTNYNNAVNAYEALDSVMTAEDKAAVEAIKAEIAEIPADGTKAQYQTQVDKAAEDIAAINAKYGDCASGNHTWGEPVLTKVPTAGAQGEYTETCGVCGATQITKVDLANYDEFNTVVGQLEDLLNTKNLTDEAKAAIEEALDKAEALNKNLPADVTTKDGKLVEGGQDEIDTLVNVLKGVVADTNAAINDGSALEPDYDAWEEAETAYDALDKTNVKAEIIAEANKLKEDIDKLQNTEGLTQATATQKDIDDATARLNEIVAGITDGTLKDPDYSKVEDKLEDANNAEGLNKDTQDKIDDIEEALEEIKGRTEPEANARDDQDEVEALEDLLDEILGAIADGTATAPDYTNWDKAEKEYDALDKANVKTEILDEVAGLKSTINALKADPTANATEDQQAIDDATARLNEIIVEINKVLTEKPDFNGYDASHDTYEELVEQYGDKIKDSVANDVAALDAIVDGVRTDETATKAEDQITVDNAKTALDAIIAGITDGSLVKPDYSEWEEAETAYDALDKTNVKDEIVAEAEALKAEIAEKQADDTLTQATATQKDIDDATARLNEIVAGITDGTLKDSADYTEVDKDLADAKDKAENNDVVDGVTDDIKDIEDKLNEIKNDPTTNADDQDEIDALEKELEKIIAGIEDGSLLPPDYSRVEAKLEEIDKTGNLNKDTQDEVDDIRSDLQAIKDKTNPVANARDDQPAVDALEKRLDDILAKIADGSGVAPDYAGVEKAIEDAEKIEILTDTDREILEGLKEELNKIKNDPTSNKKDDQSVVDAIKETAITISEKYAPCLKGEHTRGAEVEKVASTCTERGYTVFRCAVCGAEFKDDFKSMLPHDPEIIPGRAPTCSEAGLTDGEKCKVCDKIIVPQEEIAKLPHTDADEDGVCDVCHTGGLYDGCTCLCHNTHWFWQIVYMIFRIIWKVFKIHPTCACGRVHY